MTEKTQDEIAVEEYNRVSAAREITQMKAHIKEFQAFMSLCAGELLEDDWEVAWLTWCLRKGL